jgi:hypothetical protein
VRTTRGLWILTAVACVHAPPKPVEPERWPLEKEYESYVNADDTRVLLIDAPAGTLRFQCAVRGEGSYARVVVQSGDRVLTKGACGGMTDIKDVPAGQVRAEALMVGGAGVLRMTFTPRPQDVPVEAMGRPPEEALFSALGKRDGPALDALLADEFPARAAFIQQQGGFDSFELLEVQVRMYGDAASVTLVANFAGRPSQRITDAWVREGGRWRLLSRQSQPVQ